MRSVKIGPTWINDLLPTPNKGQRLGNGPTKMESRIALVCDLIDNSTLIIKLASTWTQPTVGGALVSDFWGVEPAKGG